jgi:hypothetical protein
LVFENLLGCELKFAENAENLPKEALLKINYSKQDLEGFFQIKPAGLLFENNVIEQQIKTGQWKDLITIFPTDGDIPFDLLSATFYLVTRYEEYLPHKRDLHDRFLPRNSVAYKNGFLQQPLVNEWVEQLRSELNKDFPQLQTRKSTYKFISTIDVDNAYAYLEKGIVRTTGAFLRDIFTFNFSEVKERTLAILRRKKDAYDVFDYLIEMQKKYGVETIFFFLLADYGLNDKNVPISSERFQSLIKSVNDYCRVGIHPSYSSYTDEKALRKEIRRLQQTIHRPVSLSRNHYLRLAFPRSYRQLIDLDIEEDHTMGYATELGFRASICSPFYFYDLDLEQVTQLKVHPFCMMESTVKFDYGKSPDTALDAVKPIIDRVKKVNGNCIALWHNHSLSETPPWEGWSKFYEEVLEYARA